MKNYKLPGNLYDNVKALLKVAIFPNLNIDGCNNVAVIMQSFEKIEELKEIEAAKK